MKKNFEQLYEQLVLDYYFDDYILLMDKLEKKNFYQFLCSQKGNNTQLVEKKVAEYLLENCKACKYYEIETTTDQHTLGILRSFRNKINLESIKSEIKYRYGNDAKTVYLHWSNPKGQPMDQIAMEIAEYGIHFDAYNTADLFFEFIDMYDRMAKPPMVKTKPMLSVMTDEQVQHFKQHVHQSFQSNFQNNENLMLEREC